MTQQDDLTRADLDDIETVRSEALRKLGRNVVNFARLESALKSLHASVNISGPPRKLLKIKQSRISLTHKKTFGDVMTLFSNSLLREERSPECLPERLIEPHLSLSLKVDEDKGGSQQFLHSLRKLVKERNFLLHHRLAELDSKSVASYRSLIEYLDEQQSRILPMLDFLCDIGDLLQASHIELESYLKTHLARSLLADYSFEAQQQDPPDPPPLSL